MRLGERGAQIISNRLRRIQSKKCGVYFRHKRFVGVVRILTDRAEPGHSSAQHQERGVKRFRPVRFLSGRVATVVPTEALCPRAAALGKHRSIARRSARFGHEGALDYATYIVHNRPSFRSQYGARVPV